LVREAGVIREAASLHLKLSDICWAAIVCKPGEGRNMLPMLERAFDQGAQAAVIGFVRLPDLFVFRDWLAAESEAGQR
jgi:hypothetical protein